MKMKRPYVEDDAVALAIVEAEGALNLADWVKEVAVYRDHELERKAHELQTLVTVVQRLRARWLTSGA